MARKATISSSLYILPICLFYRNKAADDETSCQIVNAANRCLPTPCCTEHQHGTHAMNRTAPTLNRPYHSHVSHRHTCATQSVLPPCRSPMAQAKLCQGLARCHCCRAHAWPLWSTHDLQASKREPGNTHRQTAGMKRGCHSKGAARCGRARLHHPTHTALKAARLG